MRKLITSYLKVKANMQKGQGMVEYGLIIAVIAVVVLIALTPVGTAVSDVFKSIVNSIRGVVPSGT